MIVPKAAHRRGPAGCAAASCLGQRPPDSLPTARLLPDPLSVAGLLLADPALPCPVELDVELPELELPDDELPDPVLPAPELPDVEAGVLPPMFRQGI